MFYKLEIIFKILVALSIFSRCDGQSLSERNGIINATQLPNLYDFPHHVGIHVTSPSSNVHCSGSILTSRWILTANSCVHYNENATMTLMFNRTNVNATFFGISEPHSYAIEVSASAKNVHRNDWANLALVHLTVSIEFNAYISPIALAIDRSENFTGRYAVMPGIMQNTTRVGYGEFEIISTSRCNATYPWVADNELCSLGWRNSSTVPCSGSQGGGLLVDWPSSPRLAGVFSAPLSCLSWIPAEYFRISHYIDWLENVMGRRVRNNGYFF